MSTHNSIRLDELSFRDNFIKDKTSHRYQSGPTLIDLQVVCKIFTLNQCSVELELRDTSDYKSLRKFHHSVFAESD